MSPPITFRQWMDKFCENKFPGSNSTFLLPSPDFPKSPIWWERRKKVERCGSDFLAPSGPSLQKSPNVRRQKKGWRRWQMRRPFERHLWTCLWGTAVLSKTVNGQKQKITMTKGKNNYAPVYERLPRTIDSSPLRHFLLEKDPHLFDYNQFWYMRWV